MNLIRLLSPLCVAMALAAVTHAALAQPSAYSSAYSSVQSPATRQSNGLVEPTEAEMRALAEIEINTINRNGGLRIEMSGVVSRPIMLKLDSYRKLDCKPYTRAFRCQADVGMSFPGTDFPAEVREESHRYQRDEQGRWARR